MTPQEKYIKANTKAYTFRFRRKNDADVIEYLDSEENKIDLIRKLIRKQIKSEK